MTLAQPVPRYAVPPRPVRRFTVDEYHRLIEEGFFAADERFELLEGLITEKVSRNPPHDSSVNRARKRLERVMPAGWTARIQSAITTRDSEPEPDVVVARGSDEDFRRRHPGPTELGLVLEVANTTLADDRSIKMRIYARAGISPYWIVNLTEQTVEVYAVPSPNEPQPSYRDRRVYRSAERVPFVLDGRLIDEIPVVDLLD